MGGKRHAPPRAICLVAYPIAGKPILCDHVFVQSFEIAAFLEEIG
jgi:hypothetical protein